MVGATLSIEELIIQTSVCMLCGVVHVVYVGYVAYAGYHYRGSTQVCEY